jgi:hypothetical protein
MAINNAIKLTTKYSLRVSDTFFNQLKKKNLFILNAYGGLHQENKFETANLKKIISKEYVLQ